MKQVILLIVSIISLSSFTLLDDWIEYKPEGLRYRILLPKLPSEETKMVGGLEAKVAIYKAASLSENNLRYYLSYSEMPVNSETLSKKDLDMFYEKAIEGSVRNQQATLISKVSTIISGHEGRLVKMKVMNGKVIAYMKLLYLEKRNYGIIVYTQTDKDNNPDIEKFLNSFEVY